MLLFSAFPFQIFANSQNVPLLDASLMSSGISVKGISVPVVEGDTFESMEVWSVEDFSFYATKQEDGTFVYVVKEGDTLSEIAEMFDISINTIRWENDMTSQSVKVGQKLTILPVTGVKHIVKNGDTLAKIATKYDADVEDISIYNGILKTDTLVTGAVIFVPNGVIKSLPQRIISSTSKSYSSSSSLIEAGYYIRPTSGRITSPYGPRRGGFHYGIDIGNSRGTPVVASASGKVISALSYCKEGKSSCGGKYGNYITIEHSNGQRTKYAHLQNVLVSVGQEVSQGQQIGTIGSTGKSTGPHLHFEVQKSNGSTIRPPF